MKFKFNANELQQIKQNCTTLRAYPLFKNAISDQINDIIFSINPICKKIDEYTLTVEEKTSAINLIAKKEDKDKAVNLFSVELIAANKKLYEVDVSVIKSSDFSDIEISGSKEVSTNNGVIKYNFKDAYYDLKNAGLIA